MIRRVKKKDIPFINNWHEAKGEVGVPFENYPKVNYVEPGVAVGYLVHTDVGIALIDGYAANPLASKEERDRALDNITGLLLDEAKVLGFKRVAALTKIPAIQHRAKGFGFIEIGTFTLLHKELP